MKILVVAVAVFALSGCGTGIPTSPVVTVAAMPSQALLGALPGELVGDLRTQADVFYTDVVRCAGKPCRVPGDVLAPASPATLPTVVLLNGGGKQFTERRYQVPLAAELAKRGSVVFLIAYRGITTLNSDQDSVSDARCAIRYARAHTADYGGDPSRVVVVGHSQGGFLGIEIAIHAEAEADACLAAGSAIPDGVIALGAPRPDLYQAAASAPPIWLFSGSKDRPAAAYAQALRSAGFDATVQILPGVTHDEITDPVATPEVVDLIVEALKTT
jgi:acetyl esterase/lipase